MGRPKLLPALLALCLVMAFNTLHATIRYVKPGGSIIGNLCARAFPSYLSSMAVRLFLLFLGHICICSAQAQTLDWAAHTPASFPLGANEESEAIARDASGNIYVTGTFRETADFDPGPGMANLTSTGTDAIYVAKYDASGAYQWAFKIGGSSNEEGNGIAVDGQGNVLVTGRFDGTADFDPGPGTANLISIGSADIFVAKYDPSGSYLWAINMGGTSSDRGFAVATDGSDNVLVTGNFQGTADFDPGAGTANLAGAGGQDIFVAKYASSGAYIWAINMGDNGFDQGGRAIAVDGSDNVVVTGNFYGTADFDPGAGTAILNSTAFSDIFVAKYASTGAYQWAFALGGANLDQGNDIAVDGSDNVLVTGFFQGTVDFDPGTGTTNLSAPQFSDVFVAKYDASGDYLWTGQLGGTSSDRGNDIAVDGSDNVLVTGSFGDTADFDPGSGTADLTSAGSSDIFVAKYTSTGAYQWAISLGGLSGDYGNGIAVDGSGNVLVTGAFRTSADFDPGPGTATLSVFENDNSDDVFIAKYDAMGAYQWAGQIGWYSTSPKSVETYAVAADAQHNSYITGYLRGAADFDPGPGTASLSATVDDIFVAKYDASGAYQWAFKLGGNSNEQGRGIAVDGSGNVLVTGRFMGTVDFDPGPNTFSLASIGINDAFIAKYDPSGAFQWAINMGGANVGADGYGIAVDGSNNVLVTGYFNGTADFDPGLGTANLASAGDFDIFVAKYNASGAYQWAKRTGGADDDRGYAIALNSSDEVMVAGVSAQESFIAKYGASGANQWAFSLGSGSANGVAVDGSGNVLVTGVFASTADFDPGPGTADLTSAGFGDFFVAKYSPSGAYQWAIGMGGTLSDVGNGIVTDPSGNQIVTGYFNGTVDFDPGPGTANLTTAGDLDIFVARYDALGTYLDAFSVGNTKGDRGTAIAVDGLGNPFVAGFFEMSADFDPQSGTANLVSLNRSDGFLARYSYCTPGGDPAVFGDNVWNAYAWNAGGPNISGDAWNLNYSGYYVEPNLSINTETRWNALGAPSDASGYAGCAVGVDNYSYSYKRRGFPQDVYSLSIDGHDDAAQLWINGTMVWEHDGCCDAHPNVWLGTLGANDEVEFRVTEGGGGSAAYLSFATPCPAGNILYVNDDASGANDGASWTDAFTGLQDALAVAGLCSGVTEIWVAEGTYKPTGDTDRSISFVMKNNLAIYGGFPGQPGQEGDFGIRDWAAYPSILSGDIGGTAHTDNSYRVIDNDFTAGDPLNSSAVLDGFTVQDAYADGSFPLNLGGGMWNSYASPTIRNCIFRNNYAAAGGGMFNADAAPTVINCLFTGNTGTAAGAGISNGSGSQLARIINCTFYGNTGPNTINNQSNAVFTNCIVWGNDGGISGGVVDYSIVQGGYGGTGNLYEDPLFADPVNGDFTLQACSPAIDAGTNTGAPTSDLDGNLRPFNATGSATVDMGVYEYQSTYDFCTTCLAGVPDVETPTASCQNIQVALVANSASITAAQIDNGSSDNCNVILSASPTTFDCSHLGQVVPVQLTVADAAGNSATCTANVTVTGVCDEGCPSAALFVNAPIHSQMGSVANWTVPAGGPYKVRITAKGAKGGDIQGGGYGAVMAGDFIVQSGQTLDANAGAPGSTIGSSVSGGGGSGVKAGNVIYVIAGGGGGAMAGLGNTYANTGTNGNTGIAGNYWSVVGEGGTNGNGGGGGGNSDWGTSSGGGGGFFSAGGDGLNQLSKGGGSGFNAMGGSGQANGGGGFGGGGGTFSVTGGGGGGYSGGGGGGNNPGGGAGSYNMGHNQTNISGIGANNAGGEVLIECLGTAVFTSDVTPTQPACANPTQGSLSIDLTGDNDGNTAGLEYAIVAGNSFTGTPTFSDITADPFDITSGFGTTGDFDGETYTVRIRLKYNPGLYVDQTYTLTAPCNCTVYVNDDAAGANNGASWTDAFTDLQDALAKAGSCSGVTEIWVAAGTYKPTGGTDRNVSFVMQNNLAIYGGFPGQPGQEGDFSLRDWAENVSILSGDIGTANDETDNSYHVISNNYNGLNNTAVLDGFTISGGNADGSYPDDRGGGMYNSLVSPLIVNCSFIGNQATRGGGVYNANPSTPTFVNCLFYNNLANDGGGAFQDIASARFQNCTFSGNSGFAISNVDATPLLANCIIWNNGAGIKNLGSFSSVAAVSYSIIQGGYPGMGNLDVDPLFADPANGDFHLQECSLAIDAGDDAANTATRDLGGNPRKIDAYSGGAQIDMGAYEAAVGDDVAPTARCQNVVVQLGAGGSATLTAGGVNNGSNDNCPYGPVPGSLLGLSLNRTNFGCADVGMRNVLLTATDAAGNSHSCVSTVIVQDHVAPEALCQNTTIQLDATGNASLTPGDVNAGSSDACGIGSLSLDVADFTCVDRGSQAVTLTVTDANSNVSQCSATVTVKDEVFGTCPCLNDQDLDEICDETDNCPAEANPGQEDFDGDGLGDACDPSLCINGAVNNLNAYVNGLNINSAYQRAIASRLDLAALKFCNGYSLNSVISTLNYVVSYVQYQSGSGIPAGAASYILAQVNTLIGALNAGTATCCPPTAPIYARPGQAAAAVAYRLDASPNPFSEQVALRFYLPEAGPVALEAFNLSGQRVKMLLSGNMEPGQHTYSWDGTDGTGRQLSAGIYLIRLRTGKEAITRRVILAR